MQTTTEQLTSAPAVESDLAAAATRASGWAGEPFLHPGEEPERVLAPDSARRRALDGALAELEAGRNAPSSDWRARARARA